MATRTIVTSHPEIACEVCGRRLLRGEQPDVFLSGGQRRMVCELCVPRATHEGWLRETEERPLSPRRSGPRRTRSLLGRLRQSRWPASTAGDDASEYSDEETPGTGDSPRTPEPLGEGLYDFLDSPLSDSEPALEPFDLDEPSGPKPVAATPRSTRASRSTPSNAELKVERALEVFNRGEYPRRIAGVARSLGAPSVRVAAVSEPGSLMALVVAWELCWYRYEVDLGDESAGARLQAQGTELEELPEQDRVANAAADERGELSLLA